MKALTKEKSHLTLGRGKCLIRSFAFQVYLGMALGRFVDLTMSWYGGETEMLLKIGEEEEVIHRTLSI